jgi:hypothetical protein
MSTTPSYRVLPDSEKLDLQRGDNHMDRYGKWALSLANIILQAKEAQATIRCFTEGMIDQSVIDCGALNQMTIVLRKGCTFRQGFRPALANVTYQEYEEVMSGKRTKNWNTPIFAPSDEESLPASHTAPAAIGVKRSHAKLRSRELKKARTNADTPPAMITKSAKTPTSATVTMSIAQCPTAPITPTRSRYRPEVQASSPEQAIKEKRANRIADKVNDQFVLDFFNATNAAISIIVGNLSNEARTTCEANDQWKAAMMRRDVIMIFYIVTHEALFAYSSEAQVAMILKNRVKDHQHYRLAPGGDFLSHANKFHAALKILRLAEYDTDESQIVEYFALSLPETSEYRNTKRELLDTHRYTDEKIRQARMSLPMAVLQFTREIHLLDRLNFRSTPSETPPDGADAIKMRALVATNNNLIAKNNALRKRLEIAPARASDATPNPTPTGERREYDPTELCRKFSAGSCKYNETTCYWRHGENDARYIKTTDGFKLKDPNRNFGPQRQTSPAARPALKAHLAGTGAAKAVPFTNHMGTANEDDN